MLKVTVNPVDASGRRYSISLEKIAADKGFIHIDPDGPQDVTVVKLYALRATGEGAITCWGDVWGPDPTIACRLLTPEDASPVLQVEIRGSAFGAYDGISNYSITPDELELVQAFLKEAAFPPASAAA